MTNTIARPLDENYQIKFEPLISGKIKKIGKNLFPFFSMFFIIQNATNYVVTNNLLHQGETKQSIENRIEKIKPTTLFEKSMKFVEYDFGKGGREICYWINGEK